MPCLMFGDKKYTGGGTNVIANPEGTPTDELNTVQIDDTVYELVGSGGGGGSFEVIDLWENTTGAGTGEQTLSNSIDDFDLLSIWCGIYAEYTGSPYVIQQCMISVSELNALYSNNKHFVFSGYDNRATYMDFYGDKVNVTNVYNNQNLLKVLGIKCGGSGTNSEEISKEDYAQIVPKQDKVYYVYGNKIDYVLSHLATGTSYKYSDASDTHENLAVFVSLSNIIYAGFFFNIDTRVSTAMTSDELSYFAKISGLNYVSDSTITLTQNANTPTLYWVNGNNRDTLYLDATDLSNVGTKCGYSGCSSQLYYDQEMSDNSVCLNGRVYSSGSASNSSKAYLFWNFKQSSLDMNQFSPAYFQSAELSSDGVVFTNTNGYIRFNDYLLKKNMTYEIKIKSMSITDTTRHNNLFRFQNLSSTQNAGLIYRYQSLKWAVWDSVNGWQESAITDKDYFNDSTLTIKTLSDGKWEIYKDGALVFSPPVALSFEGTTSWGIGSPESGYSINGMVIESVKMYHNN